MLVSLDNNSLDDGREFDEFISTTTSDNCKIDKEILWQDDCGGDISGGEHHVLNHPS